MDMDMDESRYVTGVVDVEGNPIWTGDTVLYPGRASSSIWLTKATVVGTLIKKELLGYRRDPQTNKYGPYYGPRVYLRVRPSTRYVHSGQYAVSPRTVVLSSPVLVKMKE